MIKGLIPLKWRIRGRQFLNTRANSPKAAYRRISVLGQTSDNEWIKKSATIPGWLFEGEHEFLYEMALRAPDGDFIEIGSLFGKSTCILAGAIKDRKKAETLFAVDPFTLEGSEQDSVVHQKTHNERCTFPLFVSNAKRLDFYDEVIPLASFSHKILPRLNSSISFAFIDGCHEESEVIADFELIHRSSVAGALILFHDASEAYPGVTKAIERIVGAFPRAKRIGGAGTIIALELGQESQP